jgi:hypothetical protein
MCLVRQSSSTQWVSGSNASNASPPDLLGVVLLVLSESPFPDGEFVRPRIPHIGIFQRSLQSLALLTFLRRLSGTS